MIRPHDRMELPTFATAIARYRDQTSASVASWGRTPKHNHHVGGVPASWHLVDLAVDVIYDKTPTLQVATDLAHALGLRLIRERDHDHLEPLAKGV